MRRAAKIDDNQAVIVKALRKAGCEVMSLAAIGNGCPDLLVYRGGHTMRFTEGESTILRTFPPGFIHMLEIKDGGKSPSRRKLTPHQEPFHKRWPVQVVTNETEALEAVGLIGYGD